MLRSLRRFIPLAASVVLFAACDDPTSPPPAAASLELGSFSEYLAPGQSRQITAVALDAADKPIDPSRLVWATDDSTVATISKTGIITAVRAGRTAVSATVDEKVAVAQVHVFASELHLWPDTTSLNPQGGRTLQARAVSNGVPVHLRATAWSSSDPSVARVDSTGAVTAVANGRATISAMLGGARVTSVVSVFSYPGALRFASVTGGDAHSCGLTAGGEAYCWGLGRSGELGTQQLTDRCEQISPLGQESAMRATFRCSALPVRVAGGLTFASLSAGDGITCGLTAAGAAYCWGGALSDVPVAVSGGIVFRSISVGRAVCGVSTTNAGYCWGSNFAGLLGNGTTTSSRAPVRVAGAISFDRIDVGAAHACGVATDGAAYCWGREVAGELGVGGTTGRCDGLTCSTTPLRVSGSMRFSEVEVGTFYTCGRAADGRSFCWGDGHHGKLGNGAEVHSAVPVPVSGSTTFADLAVGSGVACGLTATGRAHCWGRNVLRWDETRHLTTSVPTEAAPRFPLRSITVGSGSGCAIGTDDYLYCWGATYSGGVGNGELGMTTRLPVRVAGQ